MAKWLIERPPLAGLQWFITLINDFNDEYLVQGAQLWMQLIRGRLFERKKFLVYLVMELMIK